MQFSTDMLKAPEVSQFKPFYSHNVILYGRKITTFL